MIRKIASILRWVMVASLVSAAASQQAHADATFRNFLQSLWPEAQRLGVSRATFDTATRGLEPDLSLPDLVLPGRPERKPPPQAEFVQTPAAYVRESSIAWLAAQGKKLAQTHRATLAAIERRFGVPPAVILAIWGRETAYGAHKLPHNAVRVLATQAFLGRRKDKFRQEFLLALKILQEGHVKLADMRSSWAGAMGHTQFLPSEFYQHAVDFDGDGRRDLIRSIPDTLASAANFLVHLGWQRGQPWLQEVRVPQNLPWQEADLDIQHPVSQWAAWGVRAAHGKLPAGDLPASLLLPMGRHGPAFLAYPNFKAFLGWNSAFVYSTTVAYFATRLDGAPVVSHAAAKTVQPLSTAQMMELQRLLNKHGYEAGDVDGKLGSGTRAAVKKAQLKVGLPADSYPDAALIERLRGG
jgi:lytic murein transglycosylase